MTRASHRGLVSKLTCLNHVLWCLANILLQSGLVALQSGLCLLFCYKKRGEDPNTRFYWNSTKFPHRNYFLLINHKSIKIHFCIAT